MCVVLVDEDHLDVVDVGVHRDVVFGEVVVHEAAEGGRSRVSSCSAMPMPRRRRRGSGCAAVFGLRMRPAATALTTRVTRTMPSPRRPSPRRTPPNGCCWLNCLSTAGSGLAVTLASIAARSRAQHLGEPRCARRRRGGRRSSPSANRHRLARRPLSGEFVGLLRQLEELCAHAFARRCMTAEPADAARPRAALDGALRQAGSPSLTVDVPDRQPERLGGDLGQDRVGAGADVGRGGATSACRPAVKRGPRAGRHRAWLPRSPVAMPQPISSRRLAHRSRLGLALGPAEPLRALRSSSPQLLAGERLALVAGRCPHSSSAEARADRCRARRPARPSRIRGRTRRSGARRAHVASGVAMSSWTSLWASATLSQ